MDFLEWSCGESEKISADGFGFGEFGSTDSVCRPYTTPLPRCRSVGDYCPIDLCCHSKLEPRLQIRLIKAGKRHIGIHRHKQRVDVLAAIVLVFKARNGFARRRDRCFEIDHHNVFIQLEQFGWQLNVTILYFSRRRLAVDRQIADGSFAEIEPFRQNAACRRHSAQTAALHVR